MEQPDDAFSRIEIHPVFKKMQKSFDEHQEMIRKGDFSNYQRSLENRKDLTEKEILDYEASKLWSIYQSLYYGNIIFSDMFELEVIKARDNKARFTNLAQLQKLQERYDKGSKTRNRQLNMFWIYFINTMKC